MNMHVHKIGIVLDPEFGSQVLQLARQFHIWVAESDTNTPVIRDFWAKEVTAPATDDPLDSGVTSFEKFVAESREQTCVRMLETVDAHHGEGSHDPPWSEIEVFGLVLSPGLQAAFAEFGAEAFTSTASGFIAKRSIG
jgi:hypothetical protein